MKTRPGCENPFLVRGKTPCFASLRGKPARIGSRIVPARLHSRQIRIRAFRSRMRQASGLGDAAVILRRRDLLLHDVEHGSPGYRDEGRIDRPASLAEITSHTI